MGDFGAFENAGGRQKAGVAFALLANCLWGLMPIYFRSVSDIPPIEILSHRIVWSCVLLFGINLGRRLGGVGKFRLCSPRNALALSFTAYLLAIQWLAYLHAIATGQFLQSSLGYFVAPLVNVVLGVIFLGDHLRTAQVAAVTLAGVSTLPLFLATQGVPWIALTIAITFGAYAFIRKQVAVDGVTGLFVETVMLVAPATLLLLVRQWNDTGHGFGFAGVSMVLLIGSGAFTAAALLAYVAAAKRLPLSTLGVMQYVSPTLQFLLAVFVFSEPVCGQQIVSFGLIAVAIVLYCADIASAAYMRLSFSLMRWVARLGRLRK